MSKYINKKKNTYFVDIFLLDIGILQYLLNRLPEEICVKFLKFSLVRVSEKSLPSTKLSISMYFLLTASKIEKSRTSVDAEFNALSIRIQIL